MSEQVVRGTSSEVNQGAKNGANWGTKKGSKDWSVLGLNWACGLVALSLAFSLGLGQTVQAQEGDVQNPNSAPNCDAALTQTPSKAAKKAKTAPASQPADRLAGAFQLRDLLNPSADQNPAVQHPFVFANAAERVYALMASTPSRKALDPLYRVKPITVYPTLAGEVPETGGRMVIGQEESLDAFVRFIGGLARGERSGKAVGFPGPAGTGKTELLYVMANLEKNMAKKPQFRKFTYRFKNLHTISKLRNLFRVNRETGTYDELTVFDPDIPRSPYTLLREDLQDRVKSIVLKNAPAKWGMTLSTGWSTPEPKSAAILAAIFEHEFPEIAMGMMTVDDLTEDQYLNALQKYVVVVPQTLLKPHGREAGIIRAQTDNPNWESLFGAPNLLRMPFYGQDSALSIDYRGQIFQADGGLLMFDEMYRNTPELLNVALEIMQNRRAQGNYGEAVHLDVVPLWNANDESIDRARESTALIASLDRADKQPMRGLLSPNQIQGLIPFQLDQTRFGMRAYSSDKIEPLNHAEVFPAPDATGKTYSATGRYALYYLANEGGRERQILFAPWALDYLSWMVATTRFEVDREKLMKQSSQLNLVTANPTLFTNPVTRLRVVLGERTITQPEKHELSRAVQLLREGENGISSRDVESWIKEVVGVAVEEGHRVIAPRHIDIAFQRLLDRGTIAAPKLDIRDRWQLVRQMVKMEILLPRLEKDVKSMISGDGQKAERIYDQIQAELITKAMDENANEVTPDDGSSPVPINRARLEAVMNQYQRLFGRPFSPRFLLTQLRGAKTDGENRDPQLLQAIQTYLSDVDSSTADYVSAFNDFYAGRSVPPEVQERVVHVERRLAGSGYDAESFKEAVSYVAQLRNLKAQLEAKQPQ